MGKNEEETDLPYIKRFVYNQLIGLLMQDHTDLFDS